MAAVPYTLAQNEVKSLANPARIAAIGGDNGTEFYILFKDMPPGQQWVQPFTYNWMLSMNPPFYGAISADASQVPALPPGVVAPIATTKVATIAAYDTPQLSSTGFTPSIVNSVGNVNISQVSGISLAFTGSAGTAALPEAMRYTATSKSNVPGITNTPGTYTANLLPLTVPSTSILVGGSLIGGSPQMPGGKLFLYCQVGNNVGGGTVTFGIAFHDSITGATTGINLTTGALAANGVGFLRIAPGLSNLGGATLNDIPGITPQISVTVATGNQDWKFTLDMMP